MSFIRFENVQVKYGGYTVVEDVSLDIAKGEIVSLFGPSGSGKTTLLKVLLNIIRPDAGKVTLDGMDISCYASPIAYVPQFNDLFPWLTVQQNIGLSYQASQKKSATACLSPEASLSMVRLTAAGNKLPKELSGGMAKRTALARCLSTSSEVFLFDEAFVSVEKSLKDELLGLIREFIKKNNKTCILVSHDLAELTYMSDSVVHLSASPATVLRTVRNELPQDRTGIDFNSALFNQATGSLIIPGE